jgi:acetyl-CoA carboxylase biotin carboxyl carrier protein
MKPRAKSPSRSAAARTVGRVKSSGPSADNVAGTGPAGFELSELRRLIRLVQRTGIGELEVSSGGRTVRISALPGVSAPTASVSPAGPAAPESSGTAGGAGATDHLAAITSPLVGTFYRAPAPGADAYVETGTMVEVGQTVCIIEAMKLMNEIESEVKGRIVQVLVENAQPVEFGQKLFLVEPA